MSSYGNYLNRLNGTDKKKKKKKEEEEAYAKYMQSFAPKKTDIAPVKTTTAPKKTETKKKDDDGYFKKSNYFADGSWDKGDLINTIRGSVADLGEWFTKGAVGTGEKMVDKLAMLGTVMSNAQMSQLSNDELAFSSLKNIGKDKKTKEKEAESIVKKYETAQKDAKKSTTEFVKKDLYDEGEIAKKIISAPFEKRTGINPEEASVFGAKSRSLAESTGNMITTKLIGTILGGGMGTLAMGLSAGGGEVEEALKQGATFEGAMASGMITAGAEMAGSQFFNGVKFGGHTLTEGAVQSVARAVSGKTLQTLAKWGINTAGEGAEEVLSDFMSAVGQKLTYLNEKEFNELFSKQDAWDSFIGGMVLGGVFEGVDVASSKITGTDYVTGLTKTEQKVVDKVVEDRVAKETENGKTLSEKDKKKIRDEVIEDLDSGRISTDTIESILSGEKHKAYKDAVDKEKAILKEFEELGNKPNPSINDITRHNVVSALTKDATANRKNLKEQLDNDILPLVKGSRLAESYLESDRRKQTFKPEYEKFKGTKHEDAAKKTLENAVKIGINNTNRMRGFVELNAKYSAETGVVISYTTNEQVKKDFIERQTGRIAEIESIPEADRTETQIKDLAEMKEVLTKVKSGKIKVNGTITSDGIAINMDSSNPIDFIVGHEITHRLEKAKSYEKLKTSLKAYLGEEEWERRKKETARTYTGIDAKVENELVADLVGEYVYADYDFVKHLSATEPHIFKQAWDGLKYLYKMATAGSEEARHLERAKRNFEKAYKESANVKSEGDTNHSISNTINMEWNDQVNGLFNKQGQIKRSDTLVVEKSTPSYLQSDTTENLPLAIPLSVVTKAGNGKDISHSINQEKIADLQRGIRNSEIIIKNPDRNSFAFITDIEQDGHPVLVSFLQNADFDGDRVHKATSIHLQIDVNSMLEALPDTATIYFKNKKIFNDTVGVTNNLRSLAANIEYLEDILPQNSEKSSGKTDYSLSAEQEEYFKDSKVRDENGNLKVMYHGTSKGGFTKFDTYYTNYGLFGTGSYFTDNRSVAESYTNKGKGDNKQVYESYLNITNPIDMDAEANPEEWAKAFPDVSLPESGTNEKFLREVEDYYSYEEMPKWEVVEIIRDAIQFNMGYDGITHIGGGRFNKKDETRHRVYIAFEPEQIKNIDNVAPTSDPDIRYSLTEDSEGNKLTEKQSEYFANTKAVDRNGNLLKVYHTTKNDFTVFDKTRKGEATEDANTYLGFFFSDDAEYMQNFPEFENGKTESYYLDMKNPIDMTDISREAFMDIVEVMGGDVGDASILYDEELEAASDRAKLRGDNNVSLHLGNLLNELTGEFYYDDFIRELKPHYDELMSKGYDGVINYMDELFGVKEYIVLDSHQAKLTSNENPSADADVRYSLSEDSEGRKLSKEQQEYFKDCKLTDANGNLKVMYHGSHETFTVFDKKKARSSGTYGKGFYFTDSKSHAGTYGDSYEVYLNITNPLQNGTNDITKEQLRKFVEAIAEDEDYGIENYGYGATIDSVTDSIYGKSDFGMLLDLNVSCIGNMVEAVELFNKVNGTDYDGIVAPTETVAFYPNQIKSVTNEKPTDDPDINYSLSIEGREFSPDLTYGKDAWVQRDIAPVEESPATVSKTEKVVGTVNEDDYAPMTEAEALRNAEADKGYINSFTDADMPPEMDAPYYMPDTTSIKEKPLKDISAMARDILFLTPKERRSLEDVVQEYSTSESQNEEDLFNEIKKLFGEKTFTERIEEVADIQQVLRGYKIYVSPSIKGDIADYTHFMRKNFGKIIFSKQGLPVDTAYMELSAAHPNFFPSDIVNPSDQLQQISAVANMTKDETLTYELDDDVIREATETITEAVNSYKERQLLKTTEREGRAILRDELKKDKEAQKELTPLEKYKKRANARLEADKQVLKEEFDLRIEELRRDASDEKAFYKGLHNLEIEYKRQVKDLETEAEKKLDEFKVANQRMTKQQEYRTQMEALMGDTSFWKDKKLGISYEVNTLRRNLRDVVRDANGKRDIAKADAIYDELQGKYNHNEAELNRESNRIKQRFAEMNITKAEDRYIQMLGEFRHNPETTLTEDDIKDYLEKHKKHIDEAKVDKVIEDARTLYDDLLVKVNKVLSEQGMKEIPYRKGYFPHFREEKQGRLGKLFNWKTKDNDIPTSIAGLTEMFEPNRSWQSFNKQRTTDETEYSFLKGLDSYVQGSLDWIYHIEDIQKRRAFENHIRYTHSDEGIKEKVDAIFNSTEYDADEMQDQIDLVYREANNPLNNFIQDFHTATNSLAGKKSTFDRDLEQRTNRKVYSVMTNLSNRVSGNMVAGSVSSALTNFIPITQSWVEVSPVTSLRAMGETIVSTIRDDGTVNKSDFLTNRLNKSENLYKTTWDKVGEGVSFLMDAIDNFTSQTVWRSKYIQNMSKGMSESEAIKNADIFAANVMADRSRGNQPTLFDSKSPVAKIFTAFQLEVNNQYGYFFKDAPQDIANKSKARLITGYATAFFGAYAYNSLYSAMTGRNAAFDPIRIIEELMKDLGFGDDDEEEEIAPVDVIKNLANNIVDELPFISGLAGGGRIPISSALPYGGVKKAFEGTLEDFSEGNYKTLTKEWLSPVYYLALPMGGGQIRKTNQGIAMFSDDHPVKGSYTDSGNLRFPVEDNLKNRVQAGVFGQYANKNARTYFDEGYAPLREKQIKEYDESKMPIEDYWKYREGLKDFTKQAEKVDYINGLEISDDQKNVLKSYLYDEEGYKKENPEKYAFLEKEGIGYLGYKELDEDTQSAWSWAFKHQDEYEYYKENGVYPGDYSTYYVPMLDFEDEGDEAYQWAFDNPVKASVGKVFDSGVKEYRQYTGELYEIKGDGAKDRKKAYIWSLPIDEGQKMILFRSLYSAKKDKRAYNEKIVNYLGSRDDISYDEMCDILEELDFTVDRDTGDYSW